MPGEEPAVVIDAGRLAVAQRGHVVGDAVAGHGEFGVLGVEIEDGLAGAQGDGGRRLRRMRGLEHLRHPGQRRRVVRRDRFFLGAEVAEERAPPDAGGGGDVVDGRVVVALLREQRHRGGHEIAAHLGATGLGAATAGGCGHGTEGTKNVA